MDLSLFLEFLQEFDKHKIPSTTYPIRSDIPFEIEKLPPILEEKNES